MALYNEVIFEELFVPGIVAVYIRAIIRLFAF